MARATPANPRDLADAVAFALKSGVVLRVQTMRALVCATAVDSFAVALAIPLSRLTKLSATRSADRMPCAGPSIAAIIAPGATVAPSAMIDLNRIAGSTVEEIWSVPTQARRWPRPGFGRVRVRSSRILRR
jgi:hypothetical protein